MSSIKEQLKLRNHYLAFEALQAEVADLKARLNAVESAPAVERYVAPIPKRRGRPPKVKNGD